MKNVIPLNIISKPCDNEYWSNVINKGFRVYKGIYCWTHPLLKGLFKIGMSDDSIYKRLMSEIKETSNFGKIEIIFCIECSDPKKLETYVDRFLRNKQPELWGGTRTCSMPQEYTSNGKEFYEIDNIEVVKNYALSYTEHPVSEISYDNLIINIDLLLDSIENGTLPNLSNYCIIPNYDMNSNDHDHKKRLDNFKDKPTLHDIFTRFPIPRINQFKPDFQIKIKNNNRNYTWVDFKYDIMNGGLKISTVSEF